MTAMICGAGAVVGLIFAVFANLVALPYVLRSQERWLSTGSRLPPFVGDASRLRTLTIAMYRYCFPIFFALMGAVVAYHLFVAA